ncbi:hypothetical protein T484DRAFT_1742004 [Baffinella frigidus]|nr:hypothetical protein T484DRAFT_1742004 [Cryptophyta sp. CCMP2293]
MSRGRPPRRRSSPPPSKCPKPGRSVPAPATPNPGREQHGIAPCIAKPPTKRREMVLLDGPGRVPEAGSAWWRDEEVGAAEDTSPSARRHTDTTHQRRSMPGVLDDALRTNPSRPGPVSTLEMRRMPMPPPEPTYGTWNRSVLDDFQGLPWQLADWRFDVCRTPQEEEQGEEFRYITVIARASGHPPEHSHSIRNHDFVRHSVHSVGIVPSNEEQGTIRSRAS